MGVADVPTTANTRGELSEERPTTGLFNGASNSCLGRRVHFASSSSRPAVAIARGRGAQLIGHAGRKSGAQDAIATNCEHSFLFMTRGHEEERASLALARRPLTGATRLLAYGDGSLVSGIQRVAQDERRPPVCVRETCRRPGRRGLIQLVVSHGRDGRQLFRLNHDDEAPLSRAS